MFGKLCFALSIMLTQLPGRCQSYQSSSLTNTGPVLSSNNENIQRTETRRPMESVVGDCINRMEMELLSEATSSSKGFHVNDCSLTLNGEHIQDWRNCTIPKQLILDRDGTYTISMKVSRIRAEVYQRSTQNLSIRWNLDSILRKESKNRRLCFQTLEVYLEFRELDDLRTLEFQLDETQWNPTVRPLQIKLLRGHHHLRIRTLPLFGPHALDSSSLKTPPSVFNDSRRLSRRLRIHQSMATRDRLDPSRVPRLLLSDSPEEDNNPGDWMTDHLPITLLMGLILLLLIFFICLGIYWYCTQRRRLQSNSQRRQGDGESQLTSLESGVLSGGVDMSGYSTIMSSSWPENLKRFRYEDLWAATGGFPENGVLGEGGFGKVYSGTLLDGRSVAVKKLEGNGQQGDREFFAEVATLCRARHRNILNLVGVCIEDGNRVCVFELMDSGSVQSLLDGGDLRFTWKARLKVALGVARGLACLHESIDPPIVHRDLKTENILMDKDGEPRISDFGLCTLAHHEARNVHLRRNVTMNVGIIRGTFGYLAPEVINSGKVSTKSDVYAFGVVLLQLLTGRHPIETGRPSEEQDLVKWVLRGMEDVTILTEVVDPMIADKVSIVQLTGFVELAASCLSFSPSQRPSAIQAAMRLEELLRFKDKTEANMIPHKVDLYVHSKVSETSATIPTARPDQDGDPMVSTMTLEPARSSYLGSEMELTEFQQHHRTGSRIPDPVLTSRQEDQDGIFSPTSRRALQSTPDQAGPSDDLTPS